MLNWLILDLLRELEVVSTLLFKLEPVIMLRGCRVHMVAPILTVVAQEKHTHSVAHRNISPPRLYNLSATLLLWTGGLLVSSYMSF